jgi:bacteriocin-like protein
MEQYMSMARTEMPEMRELTDEELNVVSGGGISAFLSKLASDITEILAHGSVGGTGLPSNPQERWDRTSRNPPQA